MALSQTRRMPMRLPVILILLVGFARIDATMDLGRRFGFKFRWDFAVNDPPSLKDAWMEFKFVRYPIRLRAGRFGSTFGLENESSSNDTVFLEAGLPREFVPPQETGALVHTQGRRGRFDLSFSGATDNPLACARRYRVPARRSQRYGNG